MGILDIIYHMVNNSESKTKQKKKKKPKHKKKNKKKKKKEDINNPEKNLSSTKILIEDWEESVNRISDHPLSQAKIINTQFLQKLTNILNSMNQKLNNLNKLNDILSLLKESRAEIKIVGGDTKKIDKAIKEVEDLTVRDEEVIKILNDKGPQTAEQLSRKIGVSRSTASSRLNRLHKKGIVRKKADGRKIFYSLYS